MSVNSLSQTLNRQKIYVESKIIFQTKPENANLQLKKVCFALFLKIGILELDETRSGDSCLTWGGMTADGCWETDISFLIETLGVEKEFVNGEFISFETELEIECWTDFFLSLEV